MLGHGGTSAHHQFRCRAERLGEKCRPRRKCGGIAPAPGEALGEVVAGYCGFRASRMAINQREGTATCRRVVANLVGGTDGI